MSTGQPPQQTFLQPEVSPVPASGPSAACPTEVEGPEDRQIAEIVARLRRRYPGEQVSGADLEDRVRSSFRQFGPARIRGFVGIFVERLVRRSIEKPPITPVEARR
jgi:hypothetical protein